VYLQLPGAGLVEEQVAEIFLQELTFLSLLRVELPSSARITTINALEPTHPNWAEHFREHVFFPAKPPARRPVGTTRYVPPKNQKLCPRQAILIQIADNALSLELARRKAINLGAAKAWWAQQQRYWVSRRSRDD